MDDVSVGFFIFLLFCRLERVCVCDCVCDCVRDCVWSFHLVKSMLKAVVPICPHCLDSSSWGWVKALEFRDISLLVGTLLRRVMRVVERVHGEALGVFPEKLP